MAGAVVMVIVLVIVLPVLVLMGGAVAAGVLGGLLRHDVEQRHEGSELLETNH